MANSNKDKLPEIEEQNTSTDAYGDGPFTPKQMRSLKWLTGTMGVMIVICVILLGIGLSRQSAKLSEQVTPTISLKVTTQIQSMTADGHDGIWLHLKTDEGEVIRYYKSSGKIGPEFTIERR